MPDAKTVQLDHELKVDGLISEPMRVTAGCLLRSERLKKRLDQVGLSAVVWPKEHNRGSPGDVGFNPFEAREFHRNDARRRILMDRSDAWVSFACATVARPMTCCGGRRRTPSRSNRPGPDANTRVQPCPFSTYGASQESNLPTHWLHRPARLEDRQAASLLPPRPRLLRIVDRIRSTIAGTSLPSAIVTSTCVPCWASSVSIGIRSGGRRSVGGPRRRRQLADGRPPRTTSEL